MSEKPHLFKAWGVCTDCNFEGIIEYTHIEGESYDDPEDFGVMLVQCCPTCGTREHTLVPMDYYEEMLMHFLIVQKQDDE